MRIIQFIRKKAGLIITLLTLASITLACGDSLKPIQPERGVDQVVSTTTQTLKPEPSPTLAMLPTSTPIPSTEIPPTATSTSLPPATSALPAATRINFAPGTTYGTVAGNVQAGQRLSYVLKAQMGQPMLASVSSRDNDVTMTIIAEDGTTLLPASQGWSN